MPGLLSVVNDFSLHLLTLLQVWSQMIDKGVSYGVLSSYKHTYFLVRAAENPDTLYVSRRYGHDEDILLVTFAFIALATGNLPTKRLLLPKVDTGHWKGLGYDEENDSTMPGLVQSWVYCFPCRISTHDLLKQQYHGPVCSWKERCCHRARGGVQVGG